MTDENDDFPRRRDVTTLDDAIETRLAMVGCATWTEEQWVEHDRRVAEARDQHERLDNAERMRLRRQALLDAGFPIRGLDEAMRADETVPALGRVKRWNTREHTVLVISGITGAGKTVAACWWALNAVHAPRFVRASTFAASSRYDREARQLTLDAPGLVLDDIGVEYVDEKGSFLVDISELLDVFYSNRKPLLITTNLTADDFKKRYGQRLEDRIRECGAWSPVSTKSSLRRPRK